MAWVMLDDNFPNHPNATQAGPVAAYLYVCGLCYCRRFHTDGFIPKHAIASLGVSTRPIRMIHSLVEAGLWDITDGGWKVHDYQEFYTDAYDKEKKVERRQNGRKGGIESSRLNKIPPEPGGVGTGVVLSSSTPKKEELALAFESFWNSYPRADGRMAAFEKWLKLSPDSETRTLIMADVERRRGSPQWLKDKGQFIPHASTYLHQRRWQDGHKEAPQRLMSDSAVTVFKTLGMKV